MKLPQSFSVKLPHPHNPQAELLWMVTNQFKVLRRVSELSEPGRNEYLITASSHYSVTWHCHNNTALLKPCLTFSFFVSHFELFIFQPSMVLSFSVFQSLQLLSESSHFKFGDSVAHFFSSPFFFLIPFFLVCCSTSEIQRGAFCVWLCPKGSRLARQINNYRVHNIGENNFNIFDVKHERNQNYKEKKDDEERSWKMVFLSVSLSLGSISCYCCFLLFRSALKTLRRT